MLKYEAYNGYREISRRQKHEALFSELSEEELAQLRFMTATPGSTRPSLWEAL